jgi:hypothetical protein
MSRRFWPFESRYAWWASTLLLPATIAIAVVLQKLGVLPGARMAWWVLLGAVIIGLLPILLLVLGGVSAVKAAGVEVAFAAVQVAVQAAEETTGRSTLSDNLGAPPGVVLDTSGDTIIQALRSAVTNDVVVVNLGDGHEWWDTRLLLLIAGATRLGHPRAIAFTATLAGRPGQYLGWALPAELLRTQLSRSVRWGEAYRLAHRNTLLSSLAAPIALDAADSTMRLPWPSAGRQRVWGTVPPDQTALAKSNADGSSELPWPNPEAAWPPTASNSQGPDDPHLPERFLLDQLRPLEGSQQPEQREKLEVTAARLKDLFGPVLNTDALDTQKPGAAWVDGILDGTAPYVAITSRGQFTSLVPRDVAINAVLRSLVRDRTQPTPKQTTGSGDGAGA